MWSGAELPRLAAARAPEIGAPLIEAMAAAIDERGGDPLLCGEVYERERARDRAGRRAGGVYYTPGYVVDLVTERSVGAALAGLSRDRALKLRVIDPACGGAVFLLAALARIEAHLIDCGEQASPELRAEIVRRCLRGVDVDPVAAAVSRLALSMACGGADVGSSIACADALLDPIAGAGRFDVVLGNPPWGQKAFCFEPAQKARLRARYRTATGVLDPFKLFVERAHELARPGGRWALVLPDIILLKNQQPVRDLILERSSIEWIVDLGRAFAGVNLDSVVIAARNRRAPDRHRVRIWRRLPDDWEASPPATYTQEQRVFGELAGHRFNIHLDGGSLERLRSLRELPRLGERFEVHEGVHSGNVRAKLFVDHQPTGPGGELIVGRDEVEQYRLAWAGGWIDLGPEVVDRAAGEYANLGRPEWHRRAKIVVRRTGDRIIAARDPRGYYVSNNLFVVLPRKEMTAREMRAHVALLNSRFMTWYFRTVQPRTGRLFAELKIEHLVDFPLPGAEAWRAHRDALAELAARLEVSDDAEAVREIDRRIDSLYLTRS